MTDYLVLARRYRPRLFSEVVGQDAVVTILKNAMRQNRVAHAYLFCGSRGTGKTTLARLYAKALNCLQLTQEGEPCNQCVACREITNGSSLDILEIDGASNRGIDDIRQINETVGYSTASGQYKIYIIDEVHMLTKEAFNALLKTLEEPPPKVKFFFATTEAHKVPETILSRCQRLNLNRIPVLSIAQKLGEIASDLKISITEGALNCLATRADGGLRDAESLMDQIMAFHQGEITEATVSEVFGLVAREVLFALDRAGAEGRLEAAFDIAHQVFSQGKDIPAFLESLMEHFRNILLVKLAGKSSSFLMLSESDRQLYEQSAKWYSQDQCLTLLELLAEAHTQARLSSSSRIALESVLLRILRVHQRVPVDLLVKKLSEIESKFAGSIDSVKESVAFTPSPVQAAIKPATSNKPMTPPMQPERMQQREVPVKAPLSPSMTEDPMPSAQDLGIRVKPNNVVAAAEKVSIQVDVEPVADAKSYIKKQSRYDNVMHFATVEFDGKLQKNR